MNKKEAMYFIDCLAKGYDPINGSQLESESIFNDVYFVRKLFELRDYINDQVVEEKAKKIPFALKTKDGIVTGPMCISNFVDRINDTNLEDNMKRLTRTGIMDWLINEQYINIDEDKKTITEKGKTIGIFYDSRISMSGRQYDVIMYPCKLLNSILELIESGIIS